MAGTLRAALGRRPAPMPVIVGVARSGTTMLRLMLDSHPDLAIPPETGFLPAIHARCAGGPVGPGELTELLAGSHTWRDFHLGAEALAVELRALRPFTVSDGLRAFYRLYARRFDKPRWGDKTPGYAVLLPQVQELLPEAHFIHLVRDGRDVALSLRRVWFAPGQDIATLARHWANIVRTVRRDATGCRRYLELRYEDLVAEPRRTLQRVCRFVGLRYHPAMESWYHRAPDRLAEVEDQQQPGGPLITRAQRLGQHPWLGHPPLPGRVERWRHEMPPTEVAEFERLEGELLQALGYPTGKSVGDR